MIRTAIFTTTAILALGVATAQAGTSKIINNAGEEIGVVNLKQGPEGVLLNVDINSLINH